ncbi:glycosylase [Microbacterium deminutum]|uniref:Glycoside hydrolase family 130 protein n=1 Tax=Microbacterium deminutum TaxID=344164 RepID=A0ABN2R4S1_9MICO
MTLRAHSASLDHDPSRVVSRFFLPGEGTPTAHSRMSQIIERVLAMPPRELDDVARGILADFATQQPDAEGVLTMNARAVTDRVTAHRRLTPAQLVVVGSAFTAQFAVEGAALCNPSAVVHPSQDDLGEDELRVAVSLRCIGEGHISSIGFAEAVIGADDTWTFMPRRAPLERGEISGGEWSRSHFGHALDAEDKLDDLASAVIPTLPERFGVGHLETAIDSLHPQLVRRPSSRSTLSALREVAESAYRARFSADVGLSGRVLLPVVPDEDHGVEDARFVRFLGGDDAPQYRATYTAYNGRDIAPRLLTSPDLLSFESHRLTGSGARNKGMALFPRLIHGRHLAVSRGDGENISLAGSDDGLVWEDLGILYAPTEIWELIQLGNCGAPIETSEGWLVLTHGVGPLRTYSLGALLLDLDDPTRVIRRARVPLLRPEGEAMNGYVPRVVYSCGGILHRDTVWIPVGVGDSRIRVYSIALDALWDAMPETRFAL